MKLPYLKVVPLTTAYHRGFSHRRVTLTAVKQRPMITVSYDSLKDVYCSNMEEESKAAKKCGPVMLCYASHSVIICRLNLW